MTTKAKPVTLNPAQEKALFKFAQIGGHGYGEYANLRSATAEGLKKLGFVQLGHRTMTGCRSLRWGILTQAGVDFINADRERRGLGAWKYELSTPVYGWTPNP